MAQNHVEPNSVVSNLMDVAIDAIDQLKVIMAKAKTIIDDQTPKPITPTNVGVPKALVEKTEVPKVMKVKDELKEKIEMAKTEQAKPKASNPKVLKVKEELKAKTEKAKVEKPTKIEKPVEQVKAETEPTVIIRENGSECYWDEKVPHRLWVGVDLQEPAISKKGGAISFGTAKIVNVEHLGVRLDGQVQVYAGIKRNSGNKTFTQLWNELLDESSS